MSFSLTTGGQGTVATAQVVWGFNNETYTFKSDNNFLSWITTIFQVADAVTGGSGDLLVASKQNPPVQGGTGNLFAEFDVAGGVVGNARGTGAVDWQQLRANPTEVASNIGSIIGGGSQNSSTNLYTTVAGGQVNTASGNRATVAGGESNVASGGWALISGGTNNTASGQYTSVGGGAQGVADRVGMFSHASGRFSTNGDAQAVEFVARNVTTGITTQILALDGASTLFTIRNNTVLSGICTISGFSTTGAKVGIYQRSICISNVGGTTVLQSNSVVGTDFETDPTWDVTITADNVTDSLQILCLGSLLDTVRWVAVFRGLEIGMP